MIHPFSCFGLSPEGIDCVAILGFLQTHQAAAWGPIDAENAELPPPQDKPASFPVPPNTLCHHIEPHPSHLRVTLSHVPDSSNQVTKFCQFYFLNMCLNLCFSFISSDCFAWALTSSHHLSPPLTSTKALQLLSCLWPCLTMHRPRQGGSMLISEELSVSARPTTPFLGGSKPKCFYSIPEALNGQSI